MPRKNMILNMILEDEYALVAIHCSTEAYKTAYLLNKHAGLQLEREEKDIDFKFPETTAYFPLYRFLEEQSSYEYFLVSNRYEGISTNLTLGENLFSKETKTTHYLMKEFKKVDYFLKIHEIEPKKLKDILIQINKIPQIITAYSVNTTELKSKENLIFN